MELVYLPDPLTRLGTWSTYSTWEEISNQTKVDKQRLSHSKEVKTNEKNCSICQQKKKRILSHYIKSKQIDCQNSSKIEEEDEEEGEEDEEVKRVDKNEQKN